jgi:hypothetical protein
MADTFSAEIANLRKTLEAGTYGSTPSLYSQGAALNIENLDIQMRNVTFQSKDLILQKEVSTMPCKALTFQWNRQLSYGTFGGSAQPEGVAGQYDDSDYVRAVVPMAFYTTIRRVTDAANMIDTVDGKRAEDRVASDAAIKLSADIELDLFRGKADFSNTGVFDGNQLAIPKLPNMLGIDPQIRQSDADSNTQDLMFSEYGSSQSVVIPGNGILTQLTIENAHLRAKLNFGSPDKLIIDPITLSAFSQAQAVNQRNVLGSSPQTAVGQDVRKNWVAGGEVSLEASQFLRAKTQPQRARSNGPAASTIALAQAAGSTAFTAGTVFQYYVTSVNQIGESVQSATSSITVATNANQVTVTITPPGTGGVAYFNVYRSTASGAASTIKFIGKVANSGAGTTVFTDLGNKLPGFVTGFMLSADTMKMPELSPYSRKKVGIQDLTSSEIHFRFCTLAMFEPRKNVLVDNLIGNL